MLGAHGNAEKTKVLMERQCWWSTIAKDVKQWVACFTGARFRKIPQKAPSEAVKPVDAECWKEVMKLDLPNRMIKMVAVIVLPMFVVCVTVSF